MAKDPAFLFYYQDFLVGTEFMTAEEVGLYIRILCHLADKGTLTEKHMLSICKGYAFSDAIKEKLSVDENGCFYQKRLRLEVEKRRLYSESRRNNAKAYAKHMENENENKDKDVIKDISNNNKGNGEATVKAPLLLTDDEFLTALKNNVAYKHVSFEVELAKMDAWLLTHPGCKKTRRFVVGWLNKIEKPIETVKPKKPILPEREVINEEEHKKVAALIHATAQGIGEKGE